MASYLIGDLGVTWQEGVFPLEEDGFMRRFRQKNRIPGERVLFEPILMSLTRFEQQKPLYQNDSTEVYPTDQGNFLVCHWGTCRFGYGVYMDELLERDRVRCFFDPGMLRQRPLDTITFFSTAGLHSQLLQRGGAVLHSSYVDAGGQAILFAGPSGMGKSTQATLWERYGCGRIINGDRTLLRQKNGVWHAYGYPCCGSSGVCLNESMPVKAIVLLEQGTENRLYQPTIGKKVAALMAGIEAFSWERRETDRTFNLASQLAMQVPVVMLSATPDVQAVKTLEQYLQKFGSSRKVVESKCEHR